MAHVAVEPRDAGHEVETYQGYLEGPAPRASRRLVDIRHRVAIRAIRAVTATPHNFVSRAKWGARAPRPGIETINPTGGVGEHYEGPHMGVFAHTKCAGKVRQIQNFHMDTRGWNDIAYSYLVCPHGYVFEGRGKRRRTAANGTNDGNDRFYAVCYLGGQDDPLTALAEKEMDHMVLWLRQHGGAGLGVKPHNWFKATQCPGTPVRNHCMRRDGKRFADPFAPAPPPPPAHPVFPLPAGHWFGPPSPDARNHSGYYSDTDANHLKKWQTRMKQRGWNIEVTGRFDQKTQAVAQAFNREKGIHSVPTGTVGATSWNKAWTAPISR